MTIRDYLPKREKMINLQVKVPEKLVRDVQKEMKEDNYQTWQEFLTVCFKAYLDSRAAAAENPEPDVVSRTENKKRGSK